MRIKKPIVFISGASRGIGRATALRFGLSGYPVALNCAHQIDLLKEVQATILKEKGECLIYPGDISDPNIVSSIFSDIAIKWGDLEILINNAGISHIGLFQDMKAKQYEHILKTNLFSVLHCCHAAIPGMLKLHSGSILNVSSVWGISGASCEAVYSASKGAINSFTKALGKELAPSKIRVNAVACGVIDTDMNACLTQEERSKLLDEIPCCRFASPQEVADFLFDLALNHPYLTGQVISFDGGWI